MTPVASIVIATYNRARILAYAIRSVLAGSFKDWELIVIGDGCTDETETVVRSFDDWRIRFVNLAQNSGAQSIPNNEGVKLARGEYVFFLNHDDMYFADHLAASIAYLEETGADIVFSPVVLLQRSGRGGGPCDPRTDLIILDGVSPRGFDPRIFVIASSWAMRRDACRTAGPWLVPEATRLSPSQEWLFRASRKGLRIEYHPHLSVLCIHAGARRLAYLSRESEHARAWSWIDGSAGVSADILRCIAINQAAAIDALGGYAALTKRNRWRALRDRAVDLTRHFGVHPVALRAFLDGEGRGAVIARIRAHTQAASKLAVGQSVQVGEGAAECYLVSGWHGGETTGRWTSTAMAEIGFRVPAPHAALAIEIVGHPLRVPATVSFHVNGELSRCHDYTAYDEAVVVPVAPSVQDVLLGIAVDEPISPNAFSASQDRRTLGFWLQSLRLADARVEEPWPTVRRNRHRS